MHDVHGVDYVSEPMFGRHKLDHHPTPSISTVKKEKGRRR